MGTGRPPPAYLSGGALETAPLWTRLSGVMRVAIAAAFLALSGCLPFSTVDIHIEFPRSRLENVLLTLESEVRGQKPGVTLEPIDPQVRTEAILGLAELRAARLKVLRPLLEAGVLGEGLGAVLVPQKQGISGIDAKEAELVNELTREAYIKFQQVISSGDTAKIKELIAYFDNGCPK